MGCIVDVVLTIFTLGLWIPIRAVLANRNKSDRNLQDRAFKEERKLVQVRAQEDRRLLRMQQEEERRKEMLARKD